MKIAINDLHEVYVAGYTSGNNFPTRNPFQGSSAGGMEAIIIKIDDFSISTPTPTPLPTATTTPKSVPVCNTSFLIMLFTILGWMYRI